VGAPATHLESSPTLLGIRKTPLCALATPPFVTRLVSVTVCDACNARMRAPRTPAEVVGGAVGGSQGRPQVLA
jgi:hypothetical protein